MAKQAGERATAERGQATSLRLTPEGRGLVDALQQKLGLKRSGVIELAIRRLAAVEGVSESTSEGA